MSRFLKVALPVFAIIFILGSLLVYQNKFWIASRYELWTLDQDSVLNKISGFGDYSTNIGENYINSRLQAFASNGISAEADAAIEPSMMPIYIDGKSYTYSKQTITPGAANDRCASMSSYGVYTDKTVTFENHYYTSIEADKYVSYSKSTSITEDGKVLSYYLANDDGTYTYYGGDYALMIEDIPYDILREEGAIEGTTEASSGTSEIMPVEDSTSPSPDVPVTKGDDAATDGGEPDAKELGKVVDIVQIDGKEAYVIENSFETSCDLISISRDSSATESDFSDDELVTIVTRGWYDKSDYSLIKTESYVESYTEANLISSIQSSYETSDRSVADVQGIFVFDVNTQVVSIEYPYEAYNPDAEKAELLSELSAEQYLIFVPSATGAKLTSMNVTTEADYYDPAAEHYENRKFYADGAEGTAMYNEFMSYQTDVMYISTLDYSFGSDSLDTSVSMYKEMTLTEALEYFYTDSASLTDSSIKIDGELITVKMFEQSYGRSGGSEPAPGGDAQPVDTLPPESEALEYYYSSYIFEYEGDIYFMSISGSSAVQDVVHEFTSRSTSTDYSYIKGLIDDANLFTVLPVEVDFGDMPADGSGVDSEAAYNE